MKPLLLTDLDDTLFQTARKMPTDVNKIPAADGANGETISFMQPWQHDFIHWALACMTVIPVTARGIASFKRVHLPFQQGAVCVHGAAILTPDGHLDEEWHAHMQPQLAPYQSRLPDMLTTALQIGENMGLSLRGWLESVEETSAYLVIKSNTANVEDLQKLRNILSETLNLQGFYIHMNGNNLALLPDFVNKQAAAAEMLRRHLAEHGRVPVFGMGDSVSDLGFMRLCDFAAFPPKTQICRSMP
ncbi:hypothetical protein RCF98_15310 [Thiothrix lacustris]|uniref:Trehalose phosphatase n=1 Tax=Thiothrix lacustris TaxID=525917 RepID=A0ABY9MNT0_9GAMM|nr:hypothetical protein [Thiothrix lacustris]WML90325.1 hypothetical protein RCF98_15310 [Thiothrix lacustris]